MDNTFALALLMSHACRSDVKIRRRKERRQSTTSNKTNRTVCVVCVCVFTMMLSVLSRRSVATAVSRRSLSYYTPTLVEAREGEMGTGGRTSDAGLKVAVFGASGFLGNYVCGELGMLCCRFIAVLASILENKSTVILDW
jgi:hypothetical protein